MNIATRIFVQSDLSLCYIISVIVSLIDYCFNFFMRYRKNGYHINDYHRERTVFAEIFQNLSEQMDKNNYLDNATLLSIWDAQTGY